MIGASFYVARCSAWNRIRLRLRRLREPRYLIGAVLAAAYVVFIFVVPRRARRRAVDPDAFPPGAALERYGPVFGAAGLSVMAALAWMLPARSHLFTFTEAEVSLLFPAPVSRRQLLLHRLLRSQLSLLFAAMLPVFLVARPGSGQSVLDRLMLGVGLWVVLTTVRVYFAGVTMARQHLWSSHARARRRAWIPLLVAGGAAAALVVPVVRALSVGPGSVPDAIARVGEATGTGPAAAVLWPVRLLLGPMFAEGPLAFGVSLAGAGAVLVAALAWVIGSDAVYQETGAEPAGRGRTPGSARTAPLRAARGRWPLALAGRAELAFFWKNALQTLRETNVRSFIPLAFLAMYAVVGARFWMSGGMAAAVCVAALMLGGFGALLGPGSVMNDLRGDLRHMEVVRTWPVRGGAVVRGEMLWPGLLVSAGSCLLLTAAFVLSGAAFPGTGLLWRFALYGGAMLLVPALVFAQYTVHQATAVLFPAWIPPDSGMRGFETMAQRLVLFAGVVLALAAMLAPGALAGGIAGAALYAITGSPLAVVAGAAACLATVAVEIVLISEALGPAYEQIDLSGVERVE